MRKIEEDQHAQPGEDRREEYDGDKGRKPQRQPPPVEEHDQRVDEIDQEQGEQERNDDRSASFSAAPQEMTMMMRRRLVVLRGFCSCIAHKSIRTRHCCQVRACRGGRGKRLYLADAEKGERNSRGEEDCCRRGGGNSLIRDAQHQTVEDQEEALRDTAGRLADMIEAGWDLAIGHGNGPQVGFILRRSEIAHKTEGMHEVPLDVCVADTQGAIGYELQQALQDQLFIVTSGRMSSPSSRRSWSTRKTPPSRAPTSPSAGSWTPRKPGDAGRWLDGGGRCGRGWRRMVPSPLPKEIVELDSVEGPAERRDRCDHRGRRGIPVADVGQGEYRGIPAVIDKDYASSLLARDIKRTCS